MDKVNNHFLESCPICKKGKVENQTISKWFGLISSSSLICNVCKAKFIQSGEREGQKLLKLDLSESKEKNKYENQALKISEWKKGISDLDYVVKKDLLPSYKIMNLDLILEDGEKMHYATQATLMESKTTSRTYLRTGMSTRGVSMGNSSFDSKQEIKKTDEGYIFLTNQRLFFRGQFKTKVYKLNKIMVLQETDQGVQVGSETGGKNQFYIVEEPEKLVTYTKIAIRKFSSKK
ncbi:MAG: hypothetical protein AABW82_04805 [Nanoarchaeota archaeon]